MNVGLISVLVLTGCSTSNPQGVETQQTRAEDISKYQTAVIHVVDADTGLPLANVEINHVGGKVHGVRSSFAANLPAMETAITNSDGKARLQPLGDGDKIGFSLERVDAENVVIGYFTRHQQHMNYPEYRRKGWPIGSGVTEAAVKQCNKREKGTEQFSTEGGV
jgi:Cu/Ag efflux protein CusF